MTDEEKLALQERFRGYTLPTIQLDDGAIYNVVPVHPYYYNQPMAWTKPAYTKYADTGPQLLEGSVPSRALSYSDPNTSNSASSTSTSTQGGIEIAGGSGSSLLPF